MSGQQLYDKLGQIKYPNLNKFSASSFDWLFDNDEAKPFLGWFCQAVQAEQNLLTGSELKSYEELKESKTTILEGRLLKEALEKRELVSSESLEDEIAELNTRKESLLRQKQLKTKQLHILSDRDKVLKNKLLHLEAVVSNCEKEKEKATERVKIQYSVQQEALDSLSKTTSAVAGGVDLEKLLCNHSFDSFLKREQDYTGLLTKYANMQFPQNMGVMVQNSGPDECAFIQIGDPNFANILGLNEETRRNQNWELDRLQNLLPLAEETNIVNLVRFAGARAQIETCQQMKTTLCEGQFPQSPSTLRLSKGQLESQSTTYLKEFTSLKSSVKDAIGKSTKLRCSSVIIGDCNLKLVRQEYFISKQKEFLDLLKKQWAREQLVLLAVRLEGRQLDGLKLLLDNLRRRLDREYHESRERCAALIEMADSDKKLRERHTIPSGDLVARWMLAAMQPEPENMIHDYEDMVAAAGKLHNDLHQAQQLCQLLFQAHEKQQKDLQRSVGRMEDLIFAAQLTCPTQSFSRPTELHRVISQLESARGSAQDKLKPLYRQFKAKQSALKGDHLAVLERHLWTLFFTDAASMQRKTEALKAKSGSLL